MTTQGPNYAGTASNVAFGQGNSWSSTSNAVGSTNFVSGTNFATCTTGSGTLQSDYLELTNPGFSIPSGATINGITAVLALRGAGHVSTSTIAGIFLIKGGTLSGTNLTTGSVAWPAGTTPTNITAGGSSNLGGFTWTDSDINSSSFGVAVTGQGAQSNTGLGVCGVQFTVTYTVSGVTVEQTANFFF